MPPVSMRIVHVRRLHKIGMSAMVLPCVELDVILSFQFALIQDFNLF